MSLAPPQRPRSTAGDLDFADVLFGADAATPAAEPAPRQNDEEVAARSDDANHQAVIGELSVPRTAQLAGIAQIAREHLSAGEEGQNQAAGICRALRAEGFAAVVVSRPSGGFRASRDPAGKLLAPRHAFVVVDTGSAEGADLVFVETRLAELFTAARPSAQLLTVLRELPDVFVGVAAQLEMIVNVVSAALSASFKSQGLPLPPWRRRDALLATWNIFSPLDSPNDPTAELRVGPLVPVAEAGDWEGLSDGAAAAAGRDGTGTHHQGPVTFRRA